MFDVPETKKSRKRMAPLASQKFNYIMIQKSVWVGPSPSAKNFLNYVKRYWTKK